MIACINTFPYASLIRPHLEYASAAWDPHLKKDIQLIEDVQKFAFKVCLESWNSAYVELLEKSHLPTLEARRKDAKLCHMYKIINKETFFPSAPTLVRTLAYSSRSVHPKALIPLQAHSSQYISTHSFQAPSLHGTRFPLLLPLPSLSHHLSQH